MQFDTFLISHELAPMPALTRAIEAMGFDGIWTAETAHNPFLPLALAAEHTQHVTLGTAIALAFPRSPTVLAHLAWDLARASQGRFILGLGTQVRAHNELRLGVRWEKPVRKLRETIEAIRAVWDCWQEGSPLRYQGEFFHLRLMTPFFSPPPLTVPWPPIYIAAVNEQMLRLAGSHCDGVHFHPFHTARYLREVAWPAVRTGLAQAGRDRADVTAVTSVFVVPTNGSRPAAQVEAEVRSQIAFYMSTPSYRAVVELHGWQETAQTLSKMARRGEWPTMGNLINDEMLDAFAIAGTWHQLPYILQDRYGDLLDRVAYYLPYEPGADDEGWHATVVGFRSSE